MKIEDCIFLVLTHLRSCRVVVLGVLLVGGTPLSTGCGSVRAEPGPTALPLPNSGFSPQSLGSGRSPANAHSPKGLFGLSQCGLLCVGWWEVVKDGTLCPTLQDATRKNDKAWVEAAVAEGGQELVLALSDQGIGNGWNFKGNSVHVAAAHNRPLVLDVLLGSVDKEAVVSSRDSKGNTPLFCAGGYGWEEVLFLFLLLGWGGFCACCCWALRSVCVSVRV